MKLLGAVAAAAAVFVMAGPAYADELNLIADYEKAEWHGDSLSYDSSSGALFFVNNNDGTEKNAVLEITAQGTGIYFSVDVGNGANTGDSGHCTVEFCGEDGQVLSSVSTGSINGLENYSRFYIGSEESYYPMPEGTEKIAISLHAVPDGNTGSVNVYFRNFMLFFSDEKPLGKPDADMNSIEGLTRVEVGLDPWARWVWVGAIFAVALAFYFVRKMMDKYKSPKILKPGKRN